MNTANFIYRFFKHLNASNSFHGFDDKANLLWVPRWIVNIRKDMELSGRAFVSIRFCHLDEFDTSIVHAHDKFDFYNEINIQ